MKKEFLNIISGISALLLSSTALAQTCSTPPSCESLGFDKTIADCESRPVLKCPFDNNKVYCGVYVDKDGNEYPKVCDIYYSDGTTSAELNPNKTAIGIVGYVNGNHGLVYSLIKTNAAWGPQNFDVPCLINQTGSSSDMNGKENTDCIVKTAKETGKSFPAAQFCNQYHTEGKAAGQWYLPARGEIRVTAFDSQCVEKLKKIGIYNLYDLVSSTEVDDSWICYNASSLGSATGLKSTERDIRCVFSY